MCKRESPSLHADHANGPCGDGALKATEERASTVRVNGAGSDSLPKASSSPAGTLASVTSVVRGYRLTVCEDVSPSSSIAVSRSSRWDG